MSKSILYTIDLGFNWNALTIGEAFGYTTSIYPLQYGIINPSSNIPQWQTAFYNHDGVRFHITDITHSTSATPTSVAATTGSGRVLISLDIAFANPGSVAGAFPFTTGGKYASTSSLNSAIPTLSFAQADLGTLSGTSSKVYCAENSAWQVARWSAGDNQEFQFNGSNCFSKMSVKLVVAESSAVGAPTKVFIFDPEMFVGSTENTYP